VIEAAQRSLALDGAPIAVSGVVQVTDLA